MEVRNKETIFDNPEYWCGELGYRPPGYHDFTVNTPKEISILTRFPISVLDLGCAYGFTVDRLRRLGVEAYGVDISKLAISKCRETVQDFLQIAPLWDLPFEDGVIDFGFSSGVMEHIPKSKVTKTIQEIVRVCNRGLIGLAVVDDATSEKDEDTSHSQLKSLAYWRKLFPPTFEIISDSEGNWRLDATLRVFYLYELFRGLMLKHD